MEMSTQNHIGGHVAGGDPEGTYEDMWAWAVRSDDQNGPFGGVNSVLDVGCGYGHTLLWFRRRGIKVLGVDGSEECIRESVLPADEMVQHDFSRGPWRAPEHFDLAWSCEFVEHVDEEYIDNFMAAFDRSSWVMLTHALPGQAGHHHVNCKPNSYWIRQFARYGFRFRYDLTRRARRRAGKGYFRRSGLVFQKAQGAVSVNPITHRLLAAEWFVRRAFAFLGKHGGVVAAARAWRRGPEGHQ